MDVRDLNLYALIGIAGAVMLMVGSWLDYGIVIVDSQFVNPDAFKTLQFYTFMTAGAVTLVFCLLRLVRKLYAQRKRLIAVIAFYIVGILFMYANSLTVGLDHFSPITYAGIAVGIAGCIICSYKVTGVQ